MGVHYVVILHQMLANVEVVALHLRLGGLDRLGDHVAFDRHVLIHAQLAKHAAQPIGGEATHDVVFQRDEEAGAALITLSAGTTAELVIDTPRFMPLGADDVQASRHQHFVVLGLPVRL